jgi:hypothetical protein
MKEKFIMVFCLMLFFLATISYAQQSGGGIPTSKPKDQTYQPPITQPITQPTYN